MQTEQVKKVLEKVLREAWEHGYSSSRNNSVYINSYKSRKIEELKDSFMKNFVTEIRNIKVDSFIEEQSI